MYFVLWRREEDFSVFAAVISAVLAGVLFGLTMAWLIRRKARAMKLPPWDEYLGS